MQRRPTRKYHLQQWLLLLACAFLILPYGIQAVPVQLYGINYNTRKGADFNWDKCKTREEVVRDLTLLKRLTSRIRILSLSDCGQGELVLSVAKELGLKVWLGMWIFHEEDVFELEKTFLVDFLRRGLFDDTVLGLSVGSESILRRDVTATENIQLMRDVKTILLSFDRPDVLVSICDIAPMYEFYRELVDEVDIVVVNSFPYWEGIDIDGSTDYLMDEIGPIARRAGRRDKTFIIGETGWPSDGFIEGKVASVEYQTQFFIDHFCRLDRQENWAYFWFTGIDNAWRQEQDPNNTVEGNWGIVYADLTVKPHFESLTFTCPNEPSVEFSMAEIDWTIPPLPTAAPVPLGAASCQAHTECATLAGNCCPTDEGVVLGCCPATEPQTTPAPVLQTPFPTTKQPSTPTQVTDAPTKSPTEAPTETPVDDPTVAPTRSPSTLAPTESSSEVDPTKSLPPVTSPPTFPTTPSGTPAPSPSTTFPPTRFVSHGEALSSFLALVLVGLLLIGTTA